MDIFEKGNADMLKLQTQMEAIDKRLTNTVKQSMTELKGTVLDLENKTEKFLDQIGTRMETV